MLDRNITRLILWGIGFTFGGLAYGSGWVKGQGAYYFKLEHAHTLERPFEADTGAFNESNRTQSIYAETGIDSDPLPIQFSLYSALRTIYRRDPGQGDGFVSRAMTDSKFNVKFEVAKTTLGPTQILFAPYVGLVLPTTSTRYRIGEESERQEEAPADRSFLVAPVDRGRSGGIVGLGSTVYLAPGWLNLSGATERGSDWTLYSGEVALGVGLPLNSWLQISMGRTVTDEELASGDVAQTTVNAQNTTTVSLGLTAFKGLAIEPRYTLATESDARWDRGATWGVGLSYRSL